MSERDYSFTAFLSYSSKDADFAKKVHRDLERYRIPDGLGQVDVPGARQSNRLFPVFRDREELPSGDLGKRLEENLLSSRFLIVICSPNAAASPWVAKEVAFFLKEGRRDQILTIIADGASTVDKDGRDITEQFFPPPLLQIGRDASGHVYVPLAADARLGGDGFRGAVLKLVAAMAGVNLGQLLDRDAAARQRRLLRAAAGGASVIAVVAALGVAWFYETRRADEVVRNRLSDEMRVAFEAGDPARATAIMAHLWPRETGETREAYARVLASWLPRFKSVRALIESRPAAFRANDQFYVRSHEKVRAAFPRQQWLAAADQNRGIAFALGGDGLLQFDFRTGASAPVKVEEAQTAGYIWDDMALLRSGGLIVRGANQAVSAGSTVPHVLLVNPERGQADLVSAGRGANGNFFLANDCSAAVIRRGNATDVFVFGAEANRRARVLHVGDGLYDGLAKHCSEADMQSEKRDFGVVAARRPGLQIPTLDGEAVTWRAATPVAITEEQSQKLKETITAGYYSLSDRAAYDFFAGMRTKYWHSQNGPIAFSDTTSAGSKFGIRFYCSLIDYRDEKCGLIKVHGNAGGMSAIGPYLYVDDFQFAGHPLFHLVDLRSGKRHEVTHPDYENFSGPAARSATVSPSAKLLAAPLDGQIALFEIGETISLKRVLQTGFVVPADEIDDDLDAAGPATQLRFVSETVLIGLNRDGRMFAVDIEDDRTLWTMRRRSKEGEALHAVPDLNIALLVSKRTIEVVDARTGFPLSPAFAPPAEAEKAAAAKAAKAQADLASTDDVTDFERVCDPLGRAGCRPTPAPVLRVGDTVIIQTGASAWMAHWSNPRDQDLAALAARAPCFLGWRILNGKVERFDPLALGTKEGRVVSLSALDACDL